MWRDGRVAGLTAVGLTVALWATVGGLAARTKAEQAAVAGSGGMRGGGVAAPVVPAGVRGDSAGPRWPSGCDGRVTGAEGDTTFYVVRCIKPRVR